MYHRKLASLALEKHTWNVQKTTWMTPRKKNWQTKEWTTIDWQNGKCIYKQTRRTLTRSTEHIMPKTIPATTTTSSSTSPYLQIECPMKQLWESQQPVERNKMENRDSSIYKNETKPWCPFHCLDKWRNNVTITTTWTIQTFSQEQLPAGIVRQHKIHN